MEKRELFVLGILPLSLIHIYNGIPLIRNIKLEINKGEIVTLIGPNGAGKTTILRSIIQRLPPVCGVVWLDGQQAEKMPGKEMAQRLSVVLTEQMCIRDR